MPIGTHVVSVQRGRIVPDADVPNSEGSPTVKAFLTAEGNDGYVCNHKWDATENMLHETIVTYNAADINDA